MIDWVVFWSASLALIVYNLIKNYISVSLEMYYERKIKK